MNIIEVKNVTFYYGDNKQKPAIDGLTLSIKEGETVAVVGHNGSGKSTLAKLFNGLLLPKKGDVVVNGMNTKAESDNTVEKPDYSLYDIRKTVGIVFQNPDNQMVATIIEDDVAFGPENLGLPRDEIKRRIDWALGAVGMSEYRKREPFKLSGGQKQRIAIAGALAIKPRVLVLDESTAMLDPQGRADIMKVVSDLKARENMTVIMITHFMEEAQAADRIVVMNDGKLFLDGTPQEVFAHGEDLKRIGLETPVYIRLRDELAARGLGSLAVSSEEELVEKICRL